MCRNALSLIMAVSFMAVPVAVAASNFMPLFKDECVGRSRVSLPEDVEIAAMLPKDFQVELDGGVAQPAFRFLDGEFAIDNSINYGGRLFVTHKIPHATQDAFRMHTLESRDNVSLLIAQERAAPGDVAVSVFKQLPTANQIGTAWRVDAHYLAYFNVGENSVLWRSSATPDDSSELAHDFRNVVGGLQSRPSFAIPKQEGVCLPYVFIADDGRTFRSVRTAFRMKSHPDFLVIFEDSTAFVPSGRRRSPAESLSDFWEQFEYRATVRNVRSAWHLPKTRAVPIGNRAAVASFVKITRNTGAVDFGYAAVAPGIPGAAIDTPNLMVYAIRDMVLAEKNGIAPIGEKEFIGIVERIVKSVRNRAGG